MRFRLGTPPPRGIVAYATFPFRVGFRLLSRPPCHDGCLREGFDLGFPCLRPVLMGTVSQKFVFRGAIIFSTWNLTGLVFEVFTMGQLFTKF